LFWSIDVFIGVLFLCLSRILRDRVSDFIGVGKCKY
jgi:hypothetical protein